MRSLWLCWALWALSLPGPGAALSGEHILSTLLRQLQLREAPVLDAGDVEELVTPAHVMAQYVALLQRSHGVRSRGKRFSQRFRGEDPLPPHLSPGWGRGGRRWEEPVLGALPPGRGGVRKAASPGKGSLSAPSAPAAQARGSCPTAKAVAREEGPWGSRLPSAICRLP